MLLQYNGIQLDGDSLSNSKSSDVFCYKHEDGVLNTDLRYVGGYIKSCEQVKSIKILYFNIQLPGSGCERYQQSMHYKNFLPWVIMCLIYFLSRNISCPEYTDNNLFQFHISCPNNILLLCSLPFFAHFSSLKAGPCLDLFSWPVHCCVFFFLNFLQFIVLQQLLPHSSPLLYARLRLSPAKFHSEMSVTDTLKLIQCGNWRERGILCL